MNVTDKFSFNIQVVVVVAVAVCSLLLMVEVKSNSRYGGLLQRKLILHSAHSLGSTRLEVSFNLSQRDVQVHYRDAIIVFTAIILM